MLRPVIFALTLLGLSATAFAGAPGNQVVPPSGVVLTAPDSLGAWSIGLEALYVQPTGDNYQYTQVADLGTNTISNKSVQPGYNWGGSIDLTYRFAGSSRDITLGYTHLDTDDSDTTTVSAPAFFSNGFVLGATKAKGEVENDYNAIDLIIGQQLLVGDRVVFHPFLGLRYAGIDQENKVSFSDSAVQTGTGSLKLNSDFDGVGPRAGVDVRVLSDCGLSLVGTLGGALLVGNDSSKVSANPVALSALAPTEWHNDSTTEVVPELDGRVALDYTPHAFFPEASVGFQLGYEVVHYFDVANLNGLDTIATNSVSSNSAFSYQGPYFRLQLNFT